MQRYLYLTALLGLGLCLAGCSLNPWEGKYACKGYPEGVRCHSAREVYNLTNYRAALGDPAEEDQENCAECGERPNLAEPTQSGYVTEVTPESTAAVRGLGYTGPMPLRSSAQIMRIWLAPWESIDGVLHLPTYLYAEVEARRWSIGGRAMEVAPRITPLDIRETSESARMEKKPVARRASPSASPLGSASKSVPSLLTHGPFLPSEKNAPKNSFFNRRTGESRVDNPANQ